MNSDLSHNTKGNNKKKKTKRKREQKIRYQN